MPFLVSVIERIVGSVKFIFLSYRYRADKSTIFGMRGLWGLTINSGRLLPKKAAICIFGILRQSFDI